MIVTNALVLRRSDYRDSDRMLTLLSPGYGRIEAVARGCRKAKSPLLNAAELFTAGEYVLTDVRGRHTVTQCAISDCYYPIRQDVKLLTHGAYMLYMLSLAALPDEPNEPLFMLGLHALAHLAYSSLPPELVTFGFEMHFMRVLGQSPCMDVCVKCGESFEDNARFDSFAGGVVCPKCFSGAPGISLGARRILHKAPRVKFESIALLGDRPEWPEAARFMRDFVLCHIDQRPHVLPELYSQER